MKRILVITAFPPSNIAAGENYTRQLLNDISNDFIVDVIYVRTKKQQKYTPLNNNINVKKEYVISKFRKIFNALLMFWLFPLFTAKFNIRLLFYIKSLVADTHYDALYFDFSQMFLYGKYVSHHNKIFMSHDIIAQRYKRRFGKLLTRWVANSEKWILKTSNATIFTFSKKDSELLIDLYNIKSTPTSFYLSQDVINAHPRIIGEYFVFFAMWKRPDNYQGLSWFIENVLPYTYSANFKIIGASLPDNLVEQVNKIPNVEYLGFVENPYEIIANAKALIAPLFQGAGVKVKVLDALVCGTPIIGTEVAFEGIYLDSQYEKFIIERKNDKGFIEVINSFDNINIEQRLDMKRYFMEQFSYKPVLQFLRKMNK